MKSLAIILAVFCGGCAHMTDRERGHEAGAKAVRDMRDLNGPLGELAVRTAEQSPNAPDPKKSPEWNGGFRAGVRQELDHPTVSQ